MRALPALLATLVFLGLAGCQQHDGAGRRAIPQPHNGSGHATHSRARAALTPGAVAFGVLCSTETFEKKFLNNVVDWFKSPMRGAGGWLAVACSEHASSMRLC